MNRHLRRALRAVSVTAALSMAATLAVPAAHADDVPAVIQTGGGDGTTATTADLTDDSLATVTDSLDTVARGCVPYVYEWDSIWKDPARYTTANGSVWYRETGGASPRIICPAAVRLRAWIMDETVPNGERVWDTYISRIEQKFSTSATPSIVASVDVPYEGIDAPGVRPYGQVTGHVEVHRRLSTGRYEMLRNGCVEFYLLHQPSIGLTQSDPTKNEGYGFGPCPSTAKVALYDADDNIGVG